MLQVLPSQPMLAMPTCGFCISSSLNPTPYNIAWEPTCERVCVSIRLYLLRWPLTVVTAMIVISFFR